MGGSSSWMQAEGGSELLPLPSAPLALQLCPPRLLLLLGGYTSTMGKTRAQAGLAVPRKGFWCPGAVPAPSASSSSEFPAPGASPGVAHLQLCSSMC